ncbi:MAG: hypothetical protein QXG97_07135, partial [Nitrososphaerota archaeon]
DTHMTHTEFPNHQMNVLLTSKGLGFNVKDYGNSVLREPDLQMVRRLTEEWNDTKDEFLKSYEATPQQQEVFAEVGIAKAEKYGRRGIQPSEWRTFGPTVKTMNEFSRSYEQFKKRCIEFVRNLSKKKDRRKKNHVSPSF